MKKTALRNGPYFTHFISLPFIDKQYRQFVQGLQNQFLKQLQVRNLKQTVRNHSHMLCHTTFFLLALPHQKTKKQLINALQQISPIISKLLQNIKFRTGDVKYFTRFNKNQKNNQLTVIYLDILDEQAIKLFNKATDILVRKLLDNEILVNQQLKPMHIILDHKDGTFKAQSPHISLFRANNLMQSQQIINLFNSINQKKKLIQLKCKYIDISTMKQYDQDGFYLPLWRLQINH